MNSILIYIFGIPYSQKKFRNIYLEIPETGTGNQKKRNSLMAGSCPSSATTQCCGPGEAPFSSAHLKNKGHIRSVVLSVHGECFSQY